MPVYSFQALDRATAPVSGTISADTARLARQRLRQRGLSVEKIEAHAATSRSTRWFGDGRRDSQRVISLIRELSTLLGVGVPLLEALDSVARQHRRRFGAMLLLLRERVSAGSSLAQAMQEH